MGQANPSILVLKIFQYNIENFNSSNLILKDLKLTWCNPRMKSSFRQPDDFHLMANLIKKGTLCDDEVDQTRSGKCDSGFLSNGITHSGIKWHHSDIVASVTVGAG